MTVNPRVIGLGALRVLVSCGEPSGELLASLLGHALRSARPGTEVIVRSQEPVFGLWEGVRTARAYRVRLKALADEATALAPDVVVPVAFSGFNLRFGRLCRAAGRPVVYLSPPQVWAWGRWRTRELGRAADSVVCLLPFEEKLLRQAGVVAAFLGHPLVDEADRVRPREETCAALGLAQRRGYVAFLPGSRPVETRFHRPLFRGVADAVEHLTGLATAFVELNGRQGWGDPQDPRMRYSIIKHARAAVVVSGTATLEAALLGTPQVVCYHLQQPSRLLARLLVRSKYFALPNILLRRRVVPELLEPAVGSILTELRPLLADPGRRRVMREDYAEIRSLLGPPGAARRIAEHIIKVAGVAVPEAVA